MTNPTPLFLMSPPRRDWALRGRANFKSRAADDVDAEAARREWSTLADAIVDAGGDVVVMPPATRDLTGLVYTAESGEFFRDDQGQLQFILPSMAVEHRRGEARHIEAFVDDVLEMNTHSTSAVWEAQGDAIRAGDADHIVHTWGVGPDGRTEEDAYREVADRLSDHHIQIAFHADPWFHGNTFLQFFRGPEAAVMLVCREALCDGEFQRLRRFAESADIVELSRQQSEGYDTNALQVRQTVIAPGDFSLSARRAAEGVDLDVRPIELDELFSKGGGAPVCLTNRLWGLRVDEVPDGVLWSNRPSIDAHTDR